MFWRSWDFSEGLGRGGNERIYLEVVGVFGVADGGGDLAHGFDANDAFQSKVGL